MPNFRELNLFLRFSWVRQLACISKFGSYASVNVAATHAWYAFERSTVQRRDTLTLQVGSGT